MKKNHVMLFCLVANLLLNSCALGTITNNAASTNTPANSLLSNALAGNTSSTTTDLLGTVLTYLLNGGKTTQQSICGVWTYTSPKVVFESENVLAQLGSAVASSKIESTLSSQLSKMGFNAGKSKVIFNNDNTCQFQLGNRTFKGTYSFDSNTNKMIITDGLGVGNVVCTTTINNGQLYMLFDADKLLSIAGNISSSTSTTSTLTSLLKNYSGLKLGWAMSK